MLDGDDDGALTLQFCLRAIQTFDSASKVAIAHLGVTERSLDHPERMLTFARWLAL